MISRSFKETIQRRIKYDPAFVRELIGEAYRLQQRGDTATSTAMIRDFLTYQKAPKIRKYYRMAYDPAYAERVWDRAWDRLFAKKASQRVLIKLADIAIREFAEMLGNPPAPNDRLRAAAERYRDTTKEG